MDPITIGAILGGTNLVGGILGSIFQSGNADKIRDMKIDDIPKEARDAALIIKSMVGKDLPGTSLAKSDVYSGQAKTISSLMDVVSNPDALAKYVMATSGSADRQLAEINVKNSLFQVDAQKANAEAKAKLADMLLNLKQYNNGLEMEAIGQESLAKQQLVQGILGAGKSFMTGYGNASYLDYLSSGKVKPSSDGKE